MPGFNASDMLKDVANSVMQAANTAQVIGEPVVAGDKTIIPAVVTRIGFGAGGGGGTTSDAEVEHTEEGSGGGGGGGVMLTPVFLIVDAEGERLLTVPGGLGGFSVVERMKGALDRVLPRKSGGQEEKGEADEA